MTYSFTEKKRIRNDFGKRSSILEVPFLLATQLDSYRDFLQVDVPADERRRMGLQAAFESVFPIESYSGDAQLQFLEYRLEDPVFDVKECQVRGLTYAAALRVRLRLALFDREGTGKERTVRDLREQEVYMGEIPLMTDSGTLVINGTERVIVSQLHRSPGVFFEHDKGKTHSSGKLLFSARVIPYRGSWLDFEFDPKDHVFVRIDRRRKLPATVLLRALERKVKDKDSRETWRPVFENDGEILDVFFKTDSLRIEQEGPSDRTRTGAVARGECPVRSHRSGRERDRGGGAAGQRPARGAARSGATSEAPVAPRPGRLRHGEGARARRGEQGDRGGPRAGERQDHPGNPGEVPRGDRPPLRCAVRERGGRGAVPFGDPSPGPHRLQSGSAGRDLPDDAPWRAADPRRRAVHVPQPVLQSRTLRPLGSGADEVQPAARASRFDRRARAFARGRRGRPEGPHRDQERPRAGGRHRPSRKPADPQRRRDGGEPVPHRAGARRTGGARTAEPVGDRGPHAAGAHQRQAGVRGGQGVLRIEPALAVHGPEQPAVGSHPQAAHLRPRAGRTDPRAGRLRGPRRPRRPTTAGCAPSRPRKGRTSGSSTRSRSTPEPTSTASSRPRTGRWRAAG